MPPKSDHDRHERLLPHAAPSHCAGARGQLADAADALESRAFAAFTTGSEAAGETGLAILAFRAQTGSRLPPEAARLLDACQTEIARVWPRLRPAGGARYALAGTLGCGLRDRA
ncbi:MAG: hypothetical protein IPH64_18345 [Comamonadaceae bacterium]|nr:hypothetical protein [Comamonadaceae bacterium]